MKRYQDANMENNVCSDHESNSGDIVKRLSGIIDWLSDVGGFASSVIMLAVSFAVIFEVISRFIFNRPTNWVVEYSIYGLVAVTFLGAAYVEKINMHIAVDFVSSRLSPKARTILETATYCLSVIFLGFFCVYGWDFFNTAWQQKRISATVLRTPMWIPYSMMMIGVSILFLQYIKQFIAKFTQLSKIIKDEQLSKKSSSTYNNSYAILSILLISFIVGFILFCSSGPLRIVGFAIILITILATGTNVFISLGIIGCVGFFVLGGKTFALFVQLPVFAYTGIESFVLVALPLFVFAGGLFARSGTTGLLFDLCNSWLNFLPGSLAMATIVSCAIFAALSGSSVATAATIGMIAIPAMIERGYDKELACGAVAAAGTLGSMIPPSNQFILYGAITDTSVGQLFMGGILPGIFVTLVFMTYIYLRYRNNPQYRSNVNISWNDRKNIAKKSFPVILAPVIIIGGIYGGMFTPTEAAAVAVIYGLVLCIFYGKIKSNNMFTILMDAVSKSSMILVIISGAMILGGLVTILQIAQEFTRFATTSGLPVWGVIVLIMLLTLALGCFMDGVALTLIVVPITFAAIVAIGLNPVWFGVLFCLNMEMGLITPPVGVTLYTVQGVTGIKLETIIKGVIPFMLLMLFCLVIVGVFEPLSTWLPSLMGR